MEGESVMRNIREPIHFEDPALEATWDALELPPGPDVPDGFRADVLEAVRGQQASEISWSGAPSWVRASAGAALALGMVVGLSVGQLPSTDVGSAQDAELDIYLDSYLAAETESAPLSPAEAFWLELEEEEEAL